MTENRGQSAERQRTHSWEDPRAVAAWADGRSGLEILSAVVEGAIAPPPFAGMLGVDLISVSEGSATFALTPAEHHYNTLGTVHGGVLSTLLDSAAGCAVHTMLPPGDAYTSLDLTVKFLRPVSLLTGRLTCTGSVEHLGRRTALARAAITDTQGQLVATALSSCLIMREQKPGPGLRGGPPNP
ncbi:PaaI family thioesterase [Streptomyces sp. NBC_01217]|uniref:PaaI family thioesterase n=1 Tax=Streptomyces sp. NBC_01217 TaxID=2903779 RepID=UPI002E0EDCE1|nr:PaaI family thioesterase [Streptomyces sp. NBC_01217]